MASLLQTSMDRSGGYNPTAPLVLLTTAFVTTRLEGIPSRKGEADDQLEAAYGMVMERALQQLQRIGELSASRGKKVSHEALAAATSGVYKSIEALQKVMSPVSFISALVTLISVGVDKVRRRALGLLTSSIQDAVANERPGSKEARAVTTAALAAVTPIADTFSGKAVAANGEVPTELTRQVALGALGALAQALGAAHPQSFVPGVSKVLLLTVVTEPQPVRSSALTCVAALVAALGQHMLPVLPATVASVLKAAKLAAAEVKASGAVGGAGAEGDQGGAKDARQEAAILELASALSAVSALVAKLGAFLAPQLPDVLAVVLHPSVLTCSAAHCTELGAGIRKELAEKVPARLLLAPLAAAFDKAAAAGADAVCALLDMLATAIGAMDAAAIASYHETVFAALLRALDSRRRAVLGADNAAEAAISADVQRMESAAVEALVELTLKLSESRFKPLFFRLLEWATAAPAAEESNSIATSTLPRLVSLFAAVNALAERLRSVFTPYFQALLDPALAALDPGGTAGTASTKKKRKKGASAAPGDGLAAELAPLDSLLRLQVIRALHRCFLYDATGFLDEARFDRILGPLVAQLHWEPPAQEVLEELPLSSGLEGSLHPAAAAALDAPARALVACLAQMSLAAGGGDARWRPLNHAVLMATRSTVTRTRLAALEAAAALAAALQEEYLPLLPEALPFLAELLEDDQHAIEARAAETVKALEELSGEDLKEYLRS